MYKKLLSFLILSLGSLAASAQPTLTSACNPVVGDRVIQYATDTFVAGSGGAALTWDFHTASNMGADTFAWDACSASAHCSTFPGTSVYGHVLGATTTAELYMHTTTTTYSIDGQYSTGAV